MNMMILDKDILTDCKSDKVLTDDNVNSPKHYQMEGLNIEVIDVIRSILGKDKFEGYCRGNVIKYISRADSKNGLEDLRKANVYLNWEIKSKEDGILNE